MRVSSLSDERIIRLVSSYFVPVWVSRDHYQLPEANRDDAKLLARIDASRRERKVPSGSVCVYIATADGTVLDTLIVHKACKPELLKPFLDQIIADGKLSARSAAATRATKAAAPVRPKKAKGHLFVVRARFDDPGANRGVSRDQVELADKECTAIVPAGKLERGQRWAVPAAVASKLLRFAYPPLPYWDAKLSKVKKVELTGKVVSVEDGQAAIRFSGDLDLTYPDKGTPTDGKVSARLAGTARIDVRSGRWQSFTLVSREGKYVWYWQEKPQPKIISFAVEWVP